ncbi:MAG: dihydropteroate synthase [Verrucomicrobiales bacterium]
MALTWQLRRQRLDLTRRGLIMGVVNVTPDSFFDGGQYESADAAVAHGLGLIDQGADILDIGGESTRPGAAPVAAGEQMRRVLPVIGRLRESTDALLSIDTASAEVAYAGVVAGADIINDVTGLRGDAAMAAVAAESRAGVIIMHMQGDPRTMQANPVYGDVVAEVREFFCQQLAVAQEAGISREALVFDPGIGFGKNLEHNLALLRRLEALAPEADRPLLLGVSRKSFIGRAIDSEAMADRFWPTVALTSFAREKGARVFRVHEVLPNVQALRMTEAILFAGE